MIYTQNTKGIYVTYAKHICKLNLSKTYLRQLEHRWKSNRSNYTFYPGRRGTFCPFLSKSANFCDAYSLELPRNWGQLNGIFNRSTYLR